VTKYSFNSFKFILFCVLAKFHATKPR
jgi:hypothetical protein